jgi:dsRNA-specific ribonuclease
MLEELQAVLGYEFSDVELLANALDRTYRNRDSFGKPDFEHMETLGDSIIGAYVKSQLSKLHNSWTPGDFHIASIKFLRNADEDAPHGSSMYRIAKFLGIEPLIKLNPGEDLSVHGARGKSKTAQRKTREHKLVDHVEAIIGSIQIDSDYAFFHAFSVLSRLFKPLGLDSTDLKSSTAFGASHTFFSSLPPLSTVSDTAAKEATTDLSGFKDYEGMNTNDRMFVIHATRGHLTEMEVIKETVSESVCNIALMLAAKNKKSNVVGWMLKEYSFDRSTLLSVLAEIKEPWFEIVTPLENKLKKLSLDTVVSAGKVTPSP